MRISLIFNYLIIVLIMEINEFLYNQKQIFWDLLAATVLELDRYPDMLKGDFVFGANDTVLSFRNGGKGFLPGVIAKAILPDVEGEKADGHMSDLSTGRCI